MTERDAAIASARGEEAGAGGGENYEHVLFRLLAANVVRTFFF